MAKEAKAAPVKKVGDLVGQWVSLTLTQGTDPKTPSYQGTVLSLDQQGVLLEYEERGNKYTSFFGHHQHQGIHRKESENVASAE